MFFGRASLYVHMKKHGPSAKDCEGGVKYICPLSGCSDKFSGKEPFLEHLKVHILGVDWELGSNSLLNLNVGDAICATLSTVVPCSFALSKKHSIHAVSE